MVKDIIIVDLLNEFEEEVSSALKQSLKKLYNEELEPILKKSPKGMGDAAFPCFSLSPSLKKSPKKIAEEIVSSLDLSKMKWIKKARARNGYANFFADWKKMAKKVIIKIGKESEKYGYHPSKGKKVILEHTSANPNGPLHIGRARNPIIGDTLVRIFRAYGYETEAQFYVDDMGKQVAILAWGMENLDVEIDKTAKSDRQLVAYYQRASRLMEEDEEVENQINQLVKKCEEGNERALSLVRNSYEKVLEGIVESLERINVHIDSFIRESRFILDGSVNKIIENLSQYCKREGKAIYLKSGNEKFFLTRSDGTSLYPTRDIAYHLWKGSQADRLVNILGEDHRLESRQVKVALKLLKAKIPEVVFYSFISLPEGKMSTRRGRVVYLDDLIDECIDKAFEEIKKRKELSEEKMEEIAEMVGMGAIRYNIIKVQPEKSILFKWEEALNFEGNSAPFIQYAHARCCSILDKAGKSGEVKEIPNEYPFNHQSEIELIKLLTELPQIVERSAEKCNPSSIANYVYELASKFNQFYRDCRVLGSRFEAPRLALVDVTKQIIKNSLNLLGIEAPKEM